MIVILAPRARSDLIYWVKTKPRLAVRILMLIDECAKHPFTGTGKPEPLRHELKGTWSRRIDDEHRLVYRVTGSGETQTLEIAACRFHYRR